MGAAEFKYVVPSVDTELEPPAYYVARGVPVPVRGGVCHNMLVDRQAFSDPAYAIAHCERWRETYPDAIVVKSQTYC